MAPRGRQTLNRLTDREARTAAAGAHLDGGGLRLIVSKTGVRTFVYRFQLNGRTRDMGIGNLANVSLAEARNRAAEARKLVKQGIDPIDAANQAKAAEQAARLKAEGGPTLAEVANQYIRTAKAGITLNTQREWAQVLRNYCANIIDRPCEQIEPEDIYVILDPLWRSRNDAARRLRHKVEKVLSFAKSTDNKGQYFSRHWMNPARWVDHLEHRYGRTARREVEGHAYLRPEAAPAFISKLREVDTNAALLLEFIALTATRSSEARLAEWGEFDLDSGLWTIPARRMKARRTHVIPLSKRALEIVEEMRRRARKGPFVFEGREAGKPFGHDTVRNNMTRINPDATPHGWRKTFKTWATETGIRDDVSEACLAHIDANASRAAYNKADLLKMQRAALEAWAGFIGSQPVENVLPLRRA
jgi:integrase